MRYFKCWSRETVRLLAFVSVKAQPGYQMAEAAKPAGKFDLLPGE